MYKAAHIRRLVGAVCLMTGAALFGATGFTAYPHGGNKSLKPSPQMGAVVLAANGIEVGKVVSISMAPDGRIVFLR